MTYVVITQDGIGRISESTPANIEGLYTEGLESCIAIVIRGTNARISIIHDTSRIDKKVIKRELKWIGALSSISIYYNPIRNTDLRSFLIEERLTELSLQHIPLLEAPQGAISVNRQNGQIDTAKLPREKLELPPDLMKRHLINILHNWAQQGDKRVNGDFQFDASVFVSCPSLHTDLNFLEKSDALLRIIHNPELNSHPIASAMKQFLTLNSSKKSLYEHQYFPSFYPLTKMASTLAIVGIIPKTSQEKTQTTSPTLLMKTNR